MTQPRLGRAAVAFTVLISAAASHAQNVIYVDDSAQTGGDGSNWQSAHRFLTDAIDQAALTPGDDDIRIAEGTYWPDESAAFPAGTGDQCASFAIPDSNLVGLTRLIGGYQGIGTPGDPDERDPDTFETVLTGDLAGNDPAWPFVGDEPGWDDNAVVIITANSGTINIDGLRIRGALQTLLNTSYNLESDSNPTWATDITIHNCFFSDSPLRYIWVPDSPCPLYDQQAGKALAISDGQYWEHDSVNNFLQNVLIEHISTDADGPLLELGGGVSSWVGGGIRECVAEAAINVDSDYDNSPHVTLSNLMFEDIRLEDITSHRADHYIIKFHDFTESHISDCSFRRIEIDETYSWMEDAPAILALEHHERDEKPSSPKIVRNCVFEDIGDPNNPDSFGGSTIHAATLVENCQFRRIVRPYGFLVYAREVTDCVFEDCDIQEDPSREPPSYSYDRFFGIDGNQVQAVGGVLARDVQDLTFNNVVCDGSILCVVGSGDNCTVANCAVVPGRSFGHAPVRAYGNATLSRFIIVDNLFGLGTDTSFDDNGSCGIILGGSLHHSLIARNRTNLGDKSFISASGAVELYSNRGVYNCVIVNNGEPVDPNGGAAHAAVNVYTQEDMPGSLVQSMICGNTGNHVGGVELWYGSTGLRMRVVNSVIANNVSTDLFINQSCLDIYDGGSSSRCTQHGFEITNSLITRDLPRYMNAAAGDYRPANGSPTIDAGDNSFITLDTFDLDNDGDTTEPIPFDADGNPRIADDVGTPGSAVDIGAYEFQGTSCLADVNNDGMVSPTDFTAWINAYNNLRPEADQNRDGIVSPTDFTAWIANFNAGC
jgi:hypothetical protein